MSGYRASSPKPTTAKIRSIADSTIAIAAADKIRKLGSVSLLYVGS